MSSPATGKAPRNWWLLPDDGIIDPLAVELAATGQRAVRLTEAERYMAAALILAGGGSPWLISHRLKVSPDAARALATAIAGATVPEARERDRPDGSTGGARHGTGTAPGNQPGHPAT